MTEAGTLAAEICAAGRWEALAEAGLDRVGLAEEYGGVGGDLLDAVDVARRAAGFAVPLAVADTLLIGGWLAAAAGFALPAGPLAVGVAGEPVPWARAAAHLVLADDSGVSVHPAGTYTVVAGTNLAGEPRDRVRVEGGPSPHRPLPDDGSPLLRGAFSRAVQISGALDRVLTMTIAYANQRQQFGRPIGRQQAVRQLVAGMAGEVAATRAAVAGATAALGSAGPGRTPDALLAVAAAKVQAGRAATLVARAAHQVHGAIGTTQEHPLHRYTTRLWSWRDEYGGEEYWAGRIGEALRDRPLWRALTG